MKRFLKYLKPYIKECIFAPLFKMLEASFELLVPLVISDLVDKGIEGNDKSRILFDGGLLLILAIVGLIAAITAQYFSAKAATCFGREVRNDLFDHINNLSFSNIDSIGTSTLITRMTSDVNQMQTGVNMVLRLFLRSPFIVFGAVYMAYRVNKRSLGIFNSTVGVLFVIVFLIILVTMPLLKKAQERLDVVTLRTRENIRGVRVIRAFNRTDEEEEEFGTAVNRLYKMQLLIGRISAFMNPLTFFVINAGIAVVLYSGAINVRDGALDKGDVIALVEYMSMILVELIKLANFIITVSRMFAGAKRVNDVFLTKADMEFPEQNQGLRISEIEFKNVAMRYKDAADDALSGVDFAAKKGEVIGIIGGTGSGKSTLAGLIPRYYDITGGSISINGKPIQSFGKEELRKRVAYVPQKAMLFKGTIADNLRWGKEDADASDIDRALTLSMSKEFVDLKEGKTEYMISESGRNLSGGQRQRLTIARAMIKDSDILILDDSSSALDFATERKLRENISTVKDDKIVFIISQRISSIKNADRILVLDKGMLVGNGDHETLRKNCEVYKEICRFQMNDDEEVAG